MTSIHRQERGVAATELVFSLPIFIVVFLVLLFYGYTFVVYRVAIDAVTTGAQAAVAVSPLTQDYDNSAPDAAQDAANRVVASFLGVERGELNSNSCIYPKRPALPATGGQYTYLVGVNFDNCSTLQKLSINFPLLGPLPPSLGTFEVDASVQL